MARDAAPLVDCRDQGAEKSTLRANNRSTATVLIEHGYLPIPVRPGEKRPAIPNWQHARLTANDWIAHEHCSVGVLTGQGEHPIVGVDIDTTDAQLAAHLADYCTRTLGATIQRIGRAPKRLMVYRAAGPDWPKLTGAWFEDLASDRHRVEVLGHGQQFVAYGIHPDTGRPYEWVDPFGGLKNRHAADLPVVTQAQISEVLAEFERLAIAHGMERVAASAATRVPTAVDDPLASHVPPVGIPLATMREKLSLLTERAADYDSWLKVGMALHHEYEGSADALRIWDEWSATAPNYQGIDDIAKRWESFGGGGRQPITARWLIHETRKVELAVCFVNFAQLANAPPPPREWILDGWLPRRCLTLLAGSGGIGKSLLALQMALAVGNGDPLFGIATVQGAVLGYFCEDDSDEILRRAADLFAAGMYAPENAGRHLHIEARTGKPNTLLFFGTDSIAHPTPLFEHLDQQCADIRPALVIIDNVAQVFAGEERNRNQVTAFCNALTGIAIRHNCAVLLLGHPAKAEGSEYSGSSAWEAAVRSRLFMGRRDDGTTVLRVAKANYAGLQELTMEWRQGAFVQLAPNTLGPATLEAAKVAVVEGIRVLTKRQISASHVATARNFLVDHMEREGLTVGATTTALRMALMELIDAGEVVVNATLPWRNSSRHAVCGLALRDEA